MDQTQTIQAWADYVIERWQLEIARLGINSSGQLLRSFTSTITTQSGGNVDKIIFAYEYYGKFVDMGVGNGVKIGNPTSSRAPKPWYNKVFYGQVKRLAEIMQEKYSNASAIAIVESIEVTKV
jgi:hypothetical protein